MMRTMDRRVYKTVAFLSLQLLIYRATTELSELRPAQKRFVYLIFPAPMVHKAIENVTWRQ